MYRNTICNGLLSDMAQDAQDSPIVLQLVAATVAAYAAASWTDRPRGWAREDLIEVKDSPVEGKGVFAKTDIPEGIAVGSFPGRPRTPQQMAAKCITAPRAGLYCFRNKNNLLIDPTDAQGNPSKYPAPGLPWIPVNDAMAYVNEPPKGGNGANVSVEDDPNDDEGLLFVTAGEIAAGSEVFVDYGLDYDRSGYGLHLKSKEDD